MKLCVFSILVLFGCVLVSCNESDPAPNNVLTYAGENVDSPLLPGGMYRTAVRFPSSIVSPHVGKRIEEIEYRIYDMPERLLLTIYGEGTEFDPGPVLYSQNLSNIAVSNVLNTAFLTRAVDITGEDLWISFEFFHAFEQRTMGCDAGPARVDGDWFYDEINDPSWFEFSSIAADINWNIAVLISN